MNRQRLRFALAGLVGLFLVGTAPALSLGQNAAPGGTPDISLHVASHWGGPINAAVVEGNRAYIANGRMLRILDLSVESNPVEMGSLELGGQRVDLNEKADGVRDVKVLGNFAFVGAAGQNFFNIVDISNPRLPNLVRSFARFTGDRALIASDVQLHGDYAYVSRESRGSTTIEVFDIRNPLNTASVALIESGGNSMLIHEGLLYRSGFGSSSFPAIAVLDITANPTNPPQIGVLDISGLWVTGLAVSGDHLYLAVRSSGGLDDPPVLGLPRRQYGVVAVDISNPALPVVTDAQPGLAGTGDIEDIVRLSAANGRLFVPDRQLDHYDPISRGLRVYDIASNPAQPTPIGPYFKEHGDIVHALLATENRLYVADSAEGFVILDTSVPHGPVRLGKYHSPELLGKLVLDGDLLYVSDNDGGFTILDVSDAQAPQVVGNYLARRHHDRRLGNWGIDKAGDIIYLAAGHSGLVTVDVADPEQPRTVGTLRITDLGSASTTSPESFFLGLTVRNAVAYVGYYVRMPGGVGQALLTAEVSDPHRPSFLGATLVWPARTLDSIAVDGPIATISGGRGEIIDVGNPAAPLVLDSGQPGGLISLPMSSGVALFNDWRMLAAWYPREGQPQLRIYDGLYIQDVSDPSDPLTVRQIKTDDPLPGCGTFPRGAVNLSVTSSASRAYVRTLDSIFIFDIADPTQPQCLHRFDGLSDGLDRKSGGNTGSSYPRYSALLTDEPRLYSTSDTLGLSILEVQGLEPPSIVVQDKIPSATLDAGQQQVIPLRIRNEGGSELQWRLEVTVRGCADPAKLGWLHLEPDAGSIGPNSSAIPTVTFDATDRKPGVYRAALCLRSNDPAWPITHLDARMNVRPPLGRK